jgi:hypothetical protein
MAFSPPATYQSVKYEEIQRFVRENLGLERFMQMENKESDPLGGLDYFRVLVMIGDYSQVSIILKLNHTIKGFKFVEYL